MLSLVIFLMAGSIQAQVTQPARYERIHRSSEREFIVISMGEKGLALVRDTEKYDGRKKNWEVIFLDNTLKEVTNMKIGVEYRMDILGYEYYNENLYLIFHDPETSERSINITEVRLDNMSTKQHLFKPEVRMHVTHFTITKNKVVFGGYISKESALLMYDLATENARIVPGIYQPNCELIDVRTNINDTFNLLLLDRKIEKNKKLVIKTFDSNGVLLVEDIIVLDEDKVVIEAITSSLQRDELVIIGSWAYGHNKQASGIFAVAVDPFTEQKINYYDFAKFDHFLDYLRPKQVARIKAKAEKRRNANKQPEFKTYTHAVRIQETKNGFSFLNEIYEATTTYNSRMSPYQYYGGLPGNPYGYYPYSPYANSRSLYGYPYYADGTGVQKNFRVQGSSVISFDGHGNFVSDQSMKFPEIKLDTKAQVSDFIHYNDTTLLLCKREKEIMLKMIGPDTVIREEKIKPQLKGINDVIRSEEQDNSSIRLWYDRYFYVYGYQSIRNNIEESSRVVFYVNKIKVD